MKKITLKTAAIERAEEMAQRLLADKANETAELNELIEKAHADIVTADRSMEDATSRGDLATYRAARQARFDAESALEMYNKRLGALEEKRLISKGDYEGAVSAILAEWREDEAAAGEALLQLAEAMGAIAADIESVQRRANYALRKLQTDLYGDEDRAMYVNGRRMVVERQKDVGISEAYTWATAVLSHYGYSKFKSQSNLAG